MTTTPIKEKVFPEEEKNKLPRPFLLRRFHSFFGLWLALYLFQHLLVNSQAALFFEDDGLGFISMVNRIHRIPYLPIVEILFLGVPFFVHGIWGIKYALTSKGNAKKNNHKNPELPQFKRNRAFTWQRITSWILLFGIAAHVVQMRFLDAPIKTYHGNNVQYMLPLKRDPGLALVAEKLNVKLYTEHGIKVKREGNEKLKNEIEATKKENYAELNSYLETKEWLEGAEKRPLKKGSVLAVAPSAGAAFFLIVRQTFENPLMVILYSLLVIFSSYHAFNGVWTFMITWGITLTRRSQKVFRHITTILMWVVSALGLIAAWGTYWTTLIQK